MSASEGFIEFLKDAMRGLGSVSMRRMFGGAGVYADGVMFTRGRRHALSQGQRGDEGRVRGRRAASVRIRGKRIDLSYWRAPERLLDDADEMAAWAGTALRVARSAAKPKAKKLRKPAGSKRRSRA